MQWCKQCCKQNQGAVLGMSLATANTRICSCSGYFCPFFCHPLNDVISLFFTSRLLWLGLSLSSTGRGIRGSQRAATGLHSEGGLGVCVGVGWGVDCEKVSAGQPLSQGVGERGRVLWMRLQKGLGLGRQTDRTTTPPPPAQAEQSHDRFYNRCHGGYITSNPPQIDTVSLHL